MPEYLLPPKVPSYLRRLRAEYAEEDRSQLVEILDACRILVIPGTHFDNWDGGTYGHDVRLFLPMYVLGKIKVREQKAIADKICEDLNACSQAYDNEFFRAVNFEPDDEGDQEWRQASPLTGRPKADPESMTIWGPGLIRLFISHRDTQKVAAKALGVALAGYGLSSFVAHDTIEPMTTWRNEILKGLETMEIMLAFVTDDFRDSVWTCQEIGYALGRGIPIVSLKLERDDPPGFIDDVQAVRGRLDDLANTASAVYRVLAERLGNRERLQTGLISAFVQAPSFSEARDRFDRLDAVVDRLSDGEVAKIIAGFQENDQLHNAIYLTNDRGRLRKFLERATGRRFSITGKRVAEVHEVETNQIPF